jgi:hypothetical protein
MALKPKKNELLPSLLAAPVAETENIYSNRHIWGIF